jgi:aspartate/methionine/tyrosine aminotransferase
MRFESALLEEWMRQYYFSTDDDIGSSGVEDYSLAELRAIAGIDLAELDAIVFRDSTSLGGAAVRAAIARRWGNGDPEWAMITHGASEAIYLVMSTLLEPGDELVVLEPTYHTHSSIARTMGCVVQRWPLHAADDYRPDLDLLRKLVNGRTRAIVVNFPHNPTGASLSADQCAELVDIAAGVGAHLVWDQCFRELVYDGEPLPDPIHTYERAVSIGSLSKGYGLPGLRVGWCLGHPDILRRTLYLRDRMTLHLSPLVELLAGHVADHADVAHPDLIDLVEPMGGVTSFPRLVGYRDTTELCHRLARQHRVLLVPGDCFGDPARVRLGFGGATPSFERGLGLLERVLGEVRAAGGPDSLPTSVAARRAAP